MQGEPPTKANTPTGAVFLSYASQDAQAAQRICEALRAAGIEVWFDQSELRGGDAWDQSIRQQIHDCRLFVAVISAHTEERHEGYFRREWRLAVERAGDMSERTAFLVPVVIDDTSESRADVPDRFRQVQWTRLPGGETPPAFAERVQKLLRSDPSAVRLAGAQGAVSGATPMGSVVSHGRSKLVPWGVSALLAVGLTYLVAERVWTSKHTQATPGSDQAATKSTSSTAPAPEPAFSPSPNSIAVLPFVNMSGDKQQEYFSDGVTEELITALSQVSALKVIARTSAFAFKGQNIEVGTIARKLNVGSILEGSVRRSGTTMRVTVQLIDAHSGFHVWSQNYDRDLKNMLVMQSDIATAVAHQLQATLSDREVAKIGLGDTEDPDARDAYLRAWATYRNDDVNELDHAIALMEEATRRDPRFARAWANLSRLYSAKFEHGEWSFLPLARTAAETALRIAPQLPVAHARMASVYAHDLDWNGALREVKAAETLDPTDPATLRARMNLNFQLGRWDEVIDAARLALVRDPMEVSNYALLAGALCASGQYQAAVRAHREAVALSPHRSEQHSDLALALLLDHRPEEALSEAQHEPLDILRDQALAMVYHALGRHDESDRSLVGLEQLPGVHPFQVAMVHAYRGDTDLAFQWLERAVTQHDPALFVIKGNIGVFPNISQDPRYAALLKKLGLPP